MTKTYNWTTPRGAKVEATITVEHITRKTISADGWPFEVKCDEWVRYIESMNVNGKPTALKELYYEYGTECILIARQGKDRILVALPQEVSDELYGEERTARAKKIERMMAFEEKIEQHRAMIRKAMDG